MARSENMMDFSNRPQRLVRSRSAVTVPGYTLYGDAALPRDWFVNVEPLDRRAAALDWTIAPHTHPKFAQMVFVLDGTGEMSLDGDVFIFKSPAVLVVPAFHIHGFNYARASKGWVVTIEIGYLGELQVRAPELRSIFEVGGYFSLSAKALTVVTQSIAALGSELGGSHRGRMIGAEVQVLQILLTLLRDRPREQSNAPSQRGDLVDRFVALVEDRFRTQPDVEAMAFALKVTTAQLRLACRMMTGLSPLAIMHERLVAEAKRCLIYSSMSVAEIAYSLGYQDAAYFSRFLAKKLGVTPTAFRRANNS